MRLTKRTGRMQAEFDHRDLGEMNNPYDKIAQPKAWVGYEKRKKELQEPSYEQSFDLSA